MNLALLHPEVQEFINNNLKTDLTKLVLKGSPFQDVTIQELANQISSKLKTEKKLPHWFSSKNIYYPPKISIEQTSSEKTAHYKSQLIKGGNLIDLTGGFGVDALYFAQQFTSVTHCEINPELSDIVSHNYKEMKVTNIKTIAGNGLHYLQQTKHKFDCIYIDPSRRNSQKGKVFLLSDCEPNVPENLDLLWSKTNQILLKNSPILDLSSAINELDFVKEIHVVALENEVKEVLFLLEKDYVKDIAIKTINLTKKENQSFDFQFNKNTTSTYSLPLTYLYEPNAAILKSGGFHEVSSQLNIFKLHPHSHLYTSKELIDFPGRVFLLEKNIKYDKRKIKQVVHDNKANITTRNFPKTVAQIRKETGLKDGGKLYLFCTTDIEQKLTALVCKKIS